MENLPALEGHGEGHWTGKEVRFLRRHGLIQFNDCGRAGKVSIRVRFICEWLLAMGGGRLLKSPMRKTKIICTLGPASDSNEKIRALVDAGADIFRLNMSHARHDWVRDVVKRIRAVSAAAGSNTAILLDTQGPAIRTG
jgi:pyruvate kinase